MGFQAGNTSSPRILDGSDVSLSQHDPRTSMHQFLAGRLTVRRNSCTRSPSMLQLSRRPSLPTSRRPGSESTSRQVAHLIYSSRVFRVSGHGWSAQKTADEDTPAMDVTTDRTQSDLSSSGRLPSVAIGPQDRVHVATRHLASKLQVGVRDHQECACRLSRSYGLPPARIGSPGPGRPTQYLPSADVDSHAIPAASASLASISVADGSCQHPSARAMADWPPAKSTEWDCPRTGAGSDEFLTRSA